MSFTFPTDTNNKAGAVRQNDGGTGFHVPSVIYGSDGVTPINSSEMKDGGNGVLVKAEIDATGKKPIMIRDTFTLESKESKLVYYESIPSLVDFLEWATNGNQCRIEIAHHGYLEEPLGLIRNDGSNIAGYYPTTITARGSGVFDIVEHNTVDNRYSYKLSRPMNFPNGFRVRVLNDGPEACTFGIMISGREF